MSASYRRTVLHGAASARAPEAADGAEQRYRMLADALNGGFLVAEVVWDDAGEAVDFLVRDVNPVAEMIAGLPPGSATGRSVLEILPGLDSGPGSILARARRIAGEGGSDRFEQYVAPLNRWLAISLYRPEPGQVAAVADDITPLKELGYANQRLEAHIDNSPLAVIEFDPEFRVTRWSHEAQRVFGYAPEDILGRTISEMRWVYEEDADLVVGQSRGFVDGSISRSVNTNRNYRKDGTVIWCEWYNSAIHDPSGRLVSVMSQVLDVTERRDTERLRNATAAIDQVIHSSLEVGDVEERSIGLAVRALEADSGTIVMRESGKLRPVATTGDLRPSEERYPGSRWETVAMQAIEGGRPVVLNDVVEAGLMGSVVRSGVAVPLFVRGYATGLVCLEYTRMPHRFTPVEIRFAERFAASLSLALENARLYQTEHAIAETLQETLVVLPHHVPGMDFCRSYEAGTSEFGRVGGDFVDVLELDKGDVAFSIGDVSGHGLDAAVMTALVRNTLRAHAIDGLPPAQVCERTNAVVVRSTSAESFVTAFFAVLEPARRLLRYVSAGHLPGLVLSRDGGLRELECRDPVLGVVDDVAFHEQRSVLEPGERLVLYTDGITEARSPEGAFLGEDGLRAAVVRHADAPVDALGGLLIEEAKRFSAGALRDDAAVLVVEPTG